MIVVLYFMQCYVKSLSGIKIPENCVERVRSELSQMDSEVKRARQRKEQQAQEQRAQEQRAQERQMQEQRKQEIFRLLYNCKAFSHTATHLPSPPPYPVTRPGRTALPKSQSVEVLDLTLSPCPSPEPKPSHANGALSLNRIPVNGIFGMRRGAGEGGLKIPETFHLEELISQEQQRERLPPLQHNMAQNSLDTLQNFHALKQHTVPSVLHQNRVNPGHMLTSQQNSSQFSAQLLRHNGSKPDINTLTNQSMHIQPFQPHVNSMSRPPHLLQPSLLQQDSHQHSLMHPHARSLHTRVRESHMPVSEPAPLSLKLSQQPQQGSLSSQSVTENSSSPQDDFSFNLDLLGQPSYSLTPQAPPSPSFSSSSPGTSSHFSSDPQSSSLSDSISPSSLFAASSEQLPLPLPNGHCSMDAQDTHKALDRMARAGSDRRHSVIQFSPLDWDTS